MSYLDPLLPLADVLDPVLDPLTVRAVRPILRIVAGPPLRAQRAALRERALPDAIARWSPRIDALAGGSVSEYDATVGAAVADLRGDAEAKVVEGSIERAAHAFDRAWYANDPEWIDDPHLPRDVRVRALDRLDRLNETIGAYEAFFAAIEPLVEQARRSGVECPTIVDLCSGHAMFAVAMALRFGAREGRCRVVATDLVPEYLGIGEAHARRLFLTESALAFVPHDALDLASLPAKIGGPIDVVTCTQSIHHFPPGFVARMLGAGASAARGGAVLVDGERNAVAGVTITLLSAFIGRLGMPIVHDSFVSLRRMYTEQELALIAALARDDEGRSLDVERGWLSPGHVFVRARTA